MGPDPTRSYEAHEISSRAGHVVSDAVTSSMTATGASDRTKTSMTLVRYCYQIEMGVRA